MRGYYLLFGYGEHITLRHVILDPEVVIVEDRGVIERIDFREEVTHKVSILTLLGWISKVLDHHSTLY